MYVCMYVCVYVCMYLYMYIYVCVYPALLRDRQGAIRDYAGDEGKEPACDNTAQKPRQ